MTETETRFHEVVTASIAECRRLSYTPAIFIRMIGEYGAVEAAARLAGATEATDGFERLWSEGRLDLTCEAMVLRPEFAELFTPAVRSRSRERLGQLGYGGAR